MSEEVSNGEVEVWTLDWDNLKGGDILDNIPKRALALLDDDSRKEFHAQMRRNRAALRPKLPRCVNCVKRPAKGSKFCTKKCAAQWGERHA